MFFLAKKVFFLSLLALLMFPTVGFAQAPADPFPPVPTRQVISVNSLLLAVLDIVWPTAVTVIVIFFVIAGFKFLNAQGNPEEIKTARRFVIWGVAGALVIMVGFSIIRIIQITLGPLFPNP